MKLYCIQCEKIVDAFPNQFSGFYHEVDRPFKTDSIKWYYDACEGIFTYSALPELPEDWELYAVEPDADEWMIMELNAKSLLLELDALV